MEQAVRQFARKVLLAHLALLAVLLIFVALASSGVYRSAEEHALAQAQQRQSLLANETARGIQSFYESIFSDLELLHPADPDDPDSDYTSDLPPEARAESGGAARPKFAQGLAGPLLSRQLEGRVSHLFLVDKVSLRPRSIGMEKAVPGPSPADIVQRAGPWLRSLDKSAMSEYLLFDDAGAPHGLHLIAIPLGGPRRALILVAAVPLRRVEHRFLDELNGHGVGMAMLIGSNDVIISSARHDLLGQALPAQADPRLTQAVANLRANGYRGTELLSSGFGISKETFAPVLLTGEPIRLNDRQWFVLIASPLSEVDAVVRQLVHRAIFWAVFVVCAITAILVSTAVQLIRGRVRLEAMRHEVLDRELKEARRIQLAWLPQGPPPKRLLVATANQPASHISGDFYNWFDLPDGRTAVAIGDVTGHGMSAAFLMASTQLLVRTTLPSLCNPGSCLAEVNRQLCVQAFNGQFVTMLLLIFDSRDGKLELASAGHPGPLCRNDAAGQFEPLKVDSNLVLGVEADTRYTTQSFKLSAGASLLLYTDGVVEADRADGSRFGVGRLKQSLVTTAITPQSLIDSVLSSVRQFCAGKRASDDLTLVAVQFECDPAQATDEERRLTGQRA